MEFLRVPGCFYLQSLTKNLKESLKGVPENQWRDFWRNLWIKAIREGLFEKIYGEFSQEILEVISGKISIRTSDQMYEEISKGFLGEISDATNGRFP